MEQHKKLPLSSRPKSIVPTLFKWASVLLFALLLIFWLASVWMQFEYAAFMEASEAEIDVSIDWASWSLEVLYFLPSVVLLWLIALVADRVDQLVWLSASREDQDAILRKRGAKKSNLGVSVG